MLSEAQVHDLIYEFLPEDITLINIPGSQFIRQLLEHPFVKLQIQMGIYTPENIASDFLSPARAQTDVGILIISMDIFENLLDGIADDIAADYIRSVAAHEAHHFHEDHAPVSASEHAKAEQKCIAEINRQHPGLANAVSYVEHNSPVYRRVYERIGRIRRDLVVAQDANRRTP